MIYVAIFITVFSVLVLHLNKQLGYILKVYVVTDKINDIVMLDYVLIQHTLLFLNMQFYSYLGHA